MITSRATLAHSCSVMEWHRQHRPTTSKCQRVKWPFLILWPLSPATSSVSWYRSCLVCSLLTYEIYGGGCPSTYVYCVVCYRVIVAPYIRSVGHVFTYLYTLDDNSERPMDYETSLFPKVFPLDHIQGRFLSPSHTVPSFGPNWQRLKKLEKPWWHRHLYGPGRFCMYCGVPWLFWTFQNNPGISTFLKTVLHP